MQYGVVVIGAGPGGYVAAIRAAQRGAQTAIIEREELGGVCLNWGCIPTKTLIHSAELFRKMSHAKEYGLAVDGLRIDMDALLARKDAVIRRNRSGIASLLKANGVDLLRGEARVTAPGKVLVGDRVLEAQSIILATGSSPAQIPGLETDGSRILNSTDALALRELPTKALIIGAGPIGAEFACIWNAFGVDVTLVEMLPRVAPNEDEELSALLEKSLRAKGIDVRTSTLVKQMDLQNNRLQVAFEGEKPDPTEFDLALVSIGRKFHSEVVADMPAPSIALGKRGVISVDDRMETSVKGIYAIGDVTGRTMLAHGASAEGLVAAENATGGNARMDYRVVPACTFTSPELASVGMSERKARESGIDVRIGRFSYAASGRAAAMGESEGLVKIVADASTDEIVGVHIFGAEAGELIAEGALAIALEATVAELAHTIHTHPTLAETVMEAAEDYFGAGIHTPPRKKGSGA